MYLLIHEVLHNLSFYFFSKQLEIPTYLFQRWKVKLDHFDF